MLCDDGQLSLLYFLSTSSYSFVYLIGKFIVDLFKLSSIWKSVYVFVITWNIVTDVKNLVSLFRSQRVHMFEVRYTTVLRKLTNITMEAVILRCIYDRQNNIPYCWRVKYKQAAGLICASQLNLKITLENCLPVFLYNLRSQIINILGD